MAPIKIGAVYPPMAPIKIGAVYPPMAPFAALAARLHGGSIP
jgi:hypothetical protein